MKDIKSATITVSNQFINNIHKNGDNEQFTITAIDQFKNKVTKEFIDAFDPKLENSVQKNQQDKREIFSLAYPKLNKTKLIGNPKFIWLPITKFTFFDKPICLKLPYHVGIGNIIERFFLGDEKKTESTVEWLKNKLKSKPLTWIKNKLKNPLRSFFEFLLFITKGFFWTYRKNTWPIIGIALITLGILFNLTFIYIGGAVLLGGNILCRLIRKGKEMLNQERYKDRIFESKAGKRLELQYLYTLKNVKNTRHSSPTLPTTISIPNDIKLDPLTKNDKNLLDSAFKIINKKNCEGIKADKAAQQNTNHEQAQKEILNKTGINISDIPSKRPLWKNFLAVIGIILCCIPFAFPLGALEIVATISIAALIYYKFFDADSYKHLKTKEQVALALRYANFMNKESEISNQTCTSYNLNYDKEPGIKPAASILSAKSSINDRPISQLLADKNTSASDKQTIFENAVRAEQTRLSSDRGDEHNSGKTLAITTKYNKLKLPHNEQQATVNASCVITRSGLTGKLNDEQKAYAKASAVKIIDSTVAGNKDKSIKTSTEVKNQQNNPYYFTEEAADQSGKVAKTILDAKKKVNHQRMSPEIKSKKTYTLLGLLSEKSTKAKLLNRFKLAIRKNNKIAKITSEFKLYLKDLNIAETEGNQFLTALLNVKADVKNALQISFPASDIFSSENAKRIYNNLCDQKYFTRSIDLIQTSHAKAPHAKADKSQNSNEKRGCDAPDLPKQTV